MEPVKDEKHKYAEQAVVFVFVLAWLVGIYEFLQVWF